MPSSVSTTPTCIGVMHARHDIGHVRAGLRTRRISRRSRKLFACFSFHICGQLLAGAEFVDQAGMNLALLFEGAVPAAALNKKVDDPDNSDEETGKQDDGSNPVHHFGRVRLPVRVRRDKIGPYGALQRLIAMASPLVQAAEEVELGILRDIGMAGHELCQLGIVAGDVVLVGQQRRIARHNRSKDRAQAKQLEELRPGFRRRPVRWAAAWLATDSVPDAAPGVSPGPRCPGRTRSGPAATAHDKTIAAMANRFT